jgi:hypothetical protein
VTLSTTDVVFGIQLLGTMSTSQKGDPDQYWSNEWMENGSEVRRSSRLYWSTEPQARNSELTICFGALHLVYAGALQKLGRAHH